MFSRNKLRIKVAPLYIYPSLVQLADTMNWDAESPVHKTAKFGIGAGPIGFSVGSQIQSGTHWILMDPRLKKRASLVKANSSFSDIWLEPSTKHF